MAVSTSRIIVMVTLAALATALVLAAVILFARGNANTPIQLIAPTPSAGSPRPDSGPTHTGGSPPALRVYISGAVRNPGVYALQPGDRLIDGLAAAGGAAEDADLSRVNLARKVQDGEHYPIPQIGQIPGAVGPTSSGQGTGQTLTPASLPAVGTGPSDPSAGGVPGQGLINLNTAPVDSLLTLPGIGPVRAKAIIDYREHNGPFGSVAEITNIPGIGPAIYENIRHLVTVEGTP